MHLMSQVLARRDDRSGRHRMPDTHQSECRRGQLPLLCLLLLIAVISEGAATEFSGRISSTDIAQSVASSLPKSQGRSAEIIANLDLTRPFETQTPWTFVAAVLPGSHTDGADTYPVEGGPLAQCFVSSLTPRCTDVPERDVDDFSTPIELYSARVVFRGANSISPLLLITTGSAHGGNGSHAIYTELFAYDRRLNEFQSVFSNITGSNNNQKTRLQELGSTLDASC
jgi:hypothetical protein